MEKKYKFEEFNKKNPAEHLVGFRWKKGQQGRKNPEIRARLTIYGHEEMSDKEFAFFKKWLTKVVPTTAKNKRGELSKVFRQTLYKQH